MNPVLLTRRLRLSDFSASNLPDLAKMNADPDVMRYFPQKLNFEESAELLKRIMAHHQQNGYALFTLHLTESDVFVGWCGLMVVPFEAHFTPAVEIGWRLNKIFWGKGLATEAAEAVLRLGFVELGLSEIVSFTAELNQPSIRVMQKIGMQSEPKDAFDHPKLPTNHPLQRHILYRLTKSLWLEQRECSKTS